MSFNGEVLTDVNYLCGVELPPGLVPAPQQHLGSKEDQDRRYRDLTCSEVLPSPEEMLDLHPQSSFMPTSSATMALDPFMASMPLSMGALHSSPTAASYGGDFARCGSNTEQCKFTLHVEVCQRADSTLRCSKLKELVLSMLRQKGTAFGELFLQEFEDPLMKEHVRSVSVTDVPYQLKVLAMHADS